MGIILSAHQPNFMPYLGFFDKMKNSDVFVIRDEVLFIKKEYHNRNRIRINGNNNLTAPQDKWLNVPVFHKDDYIKHIKINKESSQQNLFWSKKILEDIKVNYHKAPFFDEYFPEIQEIFYNSDDNLLSLNMKIINFLKKYFNIKTKVIMASELGLKPSNYQKSDASEDLVKICKALNADVYISGAGGREYLNLKPFEREGIEVRFQDYNHPVYPQRFQGFAPNMAAIDALFCTGTFPEAKQMPLLVSNAQLLSNPVDTL